MNTSPEAFLVDMLYTVFEKNAQNFAHFYHEEINISAGSETVCAADVMAANCFPTYFTVL